MPSNVMPDFELEPGFKQPTMAGARRFIGAAGALLLVLLGSVDTAKSQNSVGPSGTKWFSLETGDSWSFEDDTGKMSIRVLDVVDVDGKKAFRVGWFADGADRPYQAEYWRKEDGKYLVIGREAGARSLIFDDPYVFLTESVKPGDAWVAKLAFGGRELKLSFVAGEIETVETQAGTFEAIKITVSGPPQTVERWYAPSVGMVKERTRLTIGARTSPGNEKTLTEYTDGAKP